ncbi:hypothetical protein C8J57DRAFT_434943 [Mycena rebaudengoi]|nr:hypothetical protein C8J57DRAFT_434943 [Mycena rebaudengoi]
MEPRSLMIRHCSWAKFCNYAWELAYVIAIALMVYTEYQLFSMLIITPGSIFTAILILILIHVGRLFAFSPFVNQFFHPTFYMISLFVLLATGALTTLIYIIEEYFGPFPRPVIVLEIVCMATHNVLCLV